MTTPAQLAALLALPEKYRRRLWELGKAHGDWYGSDGIPLTVPVPTDYSWANDLLTIGHAFLPADQVTVMKATGLEPSWILGVWYLLAPDGRSWSAPSAIECALKAWEKK